MVAVVVVNVAHHVPTYPQQQILSQHIQLRVVLRGFARCCVVFFVCFQCVCVSVFPVCVCVSPEFIYSDHIVGHLMEESYTCGWWLTYHIAPYHYHPTLISFSCGIHCVHVWFFRSCCCFCRFVLAACAAAALSCVW